MVAVVQRRTRWQLWWCVSVCTAEWLIMSQLMDDDGEEDAVLSVNSSALNVSGFSDEFQFNCSSASSLLQICTSRFSFVKTVLVPAVCVIGIIGNLLTLFVLSQRRLSVASDNSVRAIHSCMKALAVSDLILCASLLPHGFLLHNCIVHVRRSFHLVYWLYSGAIINTFILTSTWLTVTMAIGRYLAVCHLFHVRPLIDLRSTRLTVTAIFVVSFIVNIPRFFENTVQSITCLSRSFSVTENELYCQSCTESYALRSFEFTQWHSLLSSLLVHATSALYRVTVMYFPGYLCLWPRLSRSFKVV